MSIILPPFNLSSAPGNPWSLRWSVPRRSAPAARTRLTEQTPGLSEVVKAPEDAAKFDVWDPANVSPFVAYLATTDCPFSGEAFLVQGGVVQRFQPWTLSEKIDRGDRWTVAELATEAGKLAPPK